MGPDKTVWVSGDQKKLCIWREEEERGRKMEMSGLYTCEIGSNPIENTMMVNIKKIRRLQWELNSFLLQARANGSKFDEKKCCAWQLCPARFSKIANEPEGPDDGLGEAPENAEDLITRHGLFAPE